MLAAPGQRTDDIPKCGQTKIYLAGFLDPLGAYPSLAEFLIPSKVYQVKLPDGEWRP
jgi:hypothetical protein